MEKKKPVIGITMGDPASIGPEVAVKALADRTVYAVCRPLLIGDAEICRKTLALCGLEFGVNPVNSVDEAAFRYGMLDVYDLRYNSPEIVSGEVSAAAGDAAFRSVRTVIGLAMEGWVDATVTGPIHKESINLAGHRFSGHTEIYAHYTGTQKYGMLLVEDQLRVIHVSTHVSLRQACDLARKERILDTIDLLAAACGQLGIDRPRIGVAGLNPHASDGGLFGTEERDEIIPAVEAARAKGYLVDGPLPADTLFPKAIGGLYDGCVAMYHDQGHIPFKTVGFNWDKQAGKMKSVRGVNITLGLPVIRTSVDHGTAMEIAGAGIASPDAMKLAIDYAVKLARSNKPSE